MNDLKVIIVGDYASQSYYIGRELEKEGFEVEYFLQVDEYTERPPKFHYLGAVRGPKIINYYYKAFWLTIGKFFKRADIQIVNGTYWKCALSSKTCYHYHGSDLRLGRVKPRTPSFVSLKELLDYSPKSVFLPRAVDPEKFKPLREVKEQREEYKDENGIDYIVGHYAHSPHIKGSHLFKQAIEEIKSEEKINIEFRNETVSHDKMLYELNFCDFILDHVNPLTGKTYNVITIEALLCETPVGTYFEEKYLDFSEMVKGLNYVDPNPEKTKETVMEMFSKRNIAKREQIINFHSPKSVTKRLLEFWKKWEFID